MNYPKDAAQVRDQIREAMSTQVDHGSAQDTGGGLGSADVWLWFGGVEYVVSVKPSGHTSETAPGLSGANKRASGGA